MNGKKLKIGDNVNIIFRYLHIIIHSFTLILLNEKLKGLQCTQLNDFNLQQLVYSNCTSRNVVRT